jgi:folate-binding protein YgfZ
MRFLKRVEPVDASLEWAVLSVIGPDAASALDVVPKTGRALALPSGGFVRAVDGGYDLVVPRDAKDAVIERLGVERVGLWAFEALRVAARRPRLGFETDHRTIPHEVGWIGTAVHLNKGCYRGQETVARVHNLGRPPRRLVLVHLSGESDELPPGSSVRWCITTNSGRSRSP